MSFMETFVIIRFISWNKNVSYNYTLSPINESNLTETISNFKH